jgi:hypothetical protein
LETAHLDDLYRAFLNVAFRGEVELLDSPHKTLEQVAGEAAAAHITRVGRCFESGPLGRN